MRSDERGSNKQHKVRETQIMTKNIKNAARNTAAATPVVEQDILMELNEDATPGPDSPEAIAGSPAKAKALAPVEADVAEAESETTPAVAEHIAGNYLDMMAEQDLTDVKKVFDEISAQFDDRMVFENHKNPANMNIQKTLEKSKKRMCSMGLATTMLVTSVDSSFINRTVTDGSRYNVYAYEKLSDLMAGLQSGVFKNAINVAIAKSLFMFRDAGVVFTGAMAMAAASDKIKVERGVTKLLARHTVSAATAPTQTSSTMIALQTLGVVVNKGTHKFPIYELRDTPATRRMETVLKTA